MPGKRNAAYTLIELTITLMIMGIVAGTAVPRYFDALTNYRGRSVAKRIEADLQYAAQVAKQTSSSTTLLFDLATHSYEIVGLTDIDRRNRNYQFNLQDSKYQGKLLQVDFAENTQVVFDIFGLPDNSGTIVFLVGEVQYTIGLSADGQITTTAVSL